MRPSLALYMHSARVTLFTRANCSLCSTAKSVISSLGKKRSFEYNEVDVMAAGQQRWKDLYEFDTPVVRHAVVASWLGATLTGGAIGTCAEDISHLLEA